MVFKQSNSTTSTSQRRRLEVNLTQDSEDEHAKVQKPKKQAKKAKKQLDKNDAEVLEVDPYNPIKEYFEPNPVQGGKDVSPSALFFWFLSCDRGPVSSSLHVNIKSLET